MIRIDTNLPEDPPLFFDECDSHARTYPSSLWLNQIQEELCHTIESRGISLHPSRYDLLHSALRDIQDFGARTYPIPLKFGSKIPIPYPLLSPDLVRSAHFLAHLEIPRLNASHEDEALNGLRSPQRFHLNWIVRRDFLGWKLTRESSGYPGSLADKVNLGRFQLEIEPKGSLIYSRSAHSKDEQPGVLLITHLVKLEKMK